MELIYQAYLTLTSILLAYYTTLLPQPQLLHEYNVVSLLKWYGEVKKKKNLKHLTYINGSLDHGFYYHYLFPQLYLSRHISKNQAVRVFTSHSRRYIAWLFPQKLILHHLWVKNLPEI